MMLDVLDSNFHIFHTYGDMLPVLNLRVTSVNKRYVNNNKVKKKYELHGFVLILIVSSCASYYYLLNQPHLLDKHIKITLIRLKLFRYFKFVCLF